MAYISQRGAYWRAEIRRRGYKPVYRTFDTKQQAQQYNIQSVPTVVVDGKFITGSERVGTHAQLPPAVEELVNKARAERTKSSAK